MLLIRWLLCLLGWHSHFVIQKYTPITKKIGCFHCGRSWVWIRNCGIWGRWTKETARAAISERKAYADRGLNSDGDAK